MLDESRHLGARIKRGTRRAPGGKPRRIGYKYLNMLHIPVLLDEVMALLRVQPGEVVIDATFGAGGYARALLDAGAKVIAVDRDESAIEAGRTLESAAGGSLSLVHGKFSELDQHVGRLGFYRADAVVFDLGVSSMQLDRAERGFSFRADGPLDMRMGGEGATAADLVNALPEEALADILYRYGEERRSRAIARAIVERRAAKPLTRTADLAELVVRVVGRAPGDQIHPATRSFQALRIAVNRELEEVALGLAAAERVLRPGGRLAVVTFHSLEDRIVKTFLAERSKAEAGSRHLPLSASPPSSFALINRKAIGAGIAETQRNPRARSAKLRGARRLDAAPRPLDLAHLGVPTLDELISSRGGRR